MAVDQELAADFNEKELAMKKITDENTAEYTKFKNQIQ